MAGWIPETRKRVENLSPLEWVGEEGGVRGRGGGNHGNGSDLIDSIA